MFRIGALTFSTALLIGCQLEDSVEKEAATEDAAAEDATTGTTEWQLIWQDEFNTAEIDLSKWDLEENCWGGGNNEQQCYTDQESNAYIEDGVLYITAINESYTGASANEDDASYDSSNTTTLPYTSARLRTKNLADFKYGRFEISAKLPSGQGTWPAIWMLPTDYVYGTWAASGEIDIMEAVNLGTDSDASDAQSGETERRVYGTLHYGETWPDNVYSGTNYELADGSSPADDFHEYAIEWEEGEIRWYVDDVHYATQTSDGWYTQYEDENGDTVNGTGAAPFDEYFHIIMNLAVGGDWAANVNDTGIDSSAFPAQMAVDYVRVYECSIDATSGTGCATESADAELVSGYEAPEIITVDDDFLSPPLTMIYEDSLDDNLYFQSYNPDGTISYSEVAVDDRGTVLQIDKTGTTGNVYLATGTEADFSDWKEDGAVVFDMRVLSSADDAEFLIKLDSGWPYVSDYSVDLPTGTDWVETTIMISDILASDNRYSAGNYADISSIVNLLVFEPTDAMSIQLDNIRLEEQ
ncbi:glycoside hydrolase family 16 protein [Reinekea marinisedimentorum]|nr:glycoside hydrolase family 16 protein [Reinekea marinisedimentorum]